MYYKLDNDEIKTMQKVEKITCTDYELLGNFIPVENMMCVINDLLCEIHNMEEKIEDMEQDIENNYEIKQENPYIEYGVSERDFL